MLPKVLLVRPFQRRSTAGTEGSCAGGTRHSPGAGSLCVKALWLTLAQSWVRLAEHVARMEERATIAEASEEVVA
jgi:hypothetical protein